MADENEKKDDEKKPEIPALKARECCPHCHRPYGPDLVSGMAGAMLGYLLGKKE